MKPFHILNRYIRMMIPVFFPITLFNLDCLFWTEMYAAEAERTIMMPLGFVINQLDIFQGTDLHTGLAGIAGVINPETGVNILKRPDETPIK